MRHLHVGDRAAGLSGKLIVLPVWQGIRGAT
jgi:hypothetical protein